jgi:FkbM family methyltransferase
MQKGLIMKEQHEECCEFAFVPKALWNSDNFESMFPPRDSRSNDFSLTDLQKTKNMEKAIEVQTISLPSLLKDKKWTHLDILKLDIEGAALAVLLQTFENGIFPDQILLEVDEMFFPSVKNYWRARKVFRLMKKYNYTCVNLNQMHWDFLFIKSK